jgi:NAD(P)-dependent dehydrogenase (short-subunit alcohol dehydrogenase family)
MPGSLVIVGGTSGIGRALAENYASRGWDVVVTGRDAARAQRVAQEIGGRTRGLALDLTEPEQIAPALASVESVQALVLAAIDRDHNHVRTFDQVGATRLATLKLVGYTEVVHTLVPHFAADAAIVLFGGLAKDRPYPGSTIVSAVNGAVTALVRTLATELAPIRVNGLHPGIVGDSPAWVDRPAAVLEAVRARTPIGRLITMGEVAQAAAFLLENRGVNGINLDIDGGWLLT